MLENPACLDVEISCEMMKTSGGDSVIDVNTIQVLGKYCEKLDPSLAFLAYKRAAGACDDDLLRVTSENGLFKNQARYLVEKQDIVLWAKVRHFLPWNVRRLTCCKCNAGDVFSSDLGCTLSSISRPRMMR